MAVSRLSSRARRRRVRIAKLVAVFVALAVPLAGVGPALPEAVAASTPPPLPQAAMSGKGEAKAPAQRVGAGKLPAPLPPGQNKVVPPSLRDIFPVTPAKPVNAATEQPAPKPVEAMPSEQVAAKGFDKQTSRELPEKRDRFSQTFANTDGTETSVLSPAPLNFEKPDGSWAEINANLQRATVAAGRRSRRRSIPGSLARRTRIRWRVSSWAMGTTSGGA